MGWGRCSARPELPDQTCCISSGCAWPLAHLQACPAVLARDNGLPTQRQTADCPPACCRPPHAPCPTWCAATPRCRCEPQDGTARCITGQLVGWQLIRMGRCRFYVLRAAGACSADAVPQHMKCPAPPISIAPDTTAPSQLRLPTHHPQAIVAKSGAAAALVEACKSPNEELREAAAVALWDLAYDSTLGREAIARAGELCGLLACCASAGQLCATFSPLSLCAAVHSPPTSLPYNPTPPTGAVPWLAQLLLVGGPGAKEAAAACLAELAAVGPAVQQQIRDAGAVQLLQSLQTSGGFDV